jgi:putative transposase
MYSYEDRIRAVELYIKLGKRARPTIRQLGYPTKNALKGWHREYEQKLDLSVGYAGREPKYSQAQKEAAAAHYLNHDRCIALTVRALGYPCRGTLTAWVREAFPESRKAIAGRLPGFRPRIARQPSPALGFGAWPFRRRRGANRKPCKPWFAP